MKSILPIIHDYIHGTAVSLRPVLLMLALVAYPFGAGSVSPGSGTPVERSRGDILTVAPGAVQFSISKRGSWLGFVPTWSPDRSLFERGGFALYARSASGDIVEVTRLTGAEPADHQPVFWCDGVCEGHPGGFRHPAPNPDDDHDGRTDEDQLDGIDNDGDGKVDEDFKAIGDNMAVVETGFQPPDTTLELTFHQECYAWSLPHIENMVIVNLRVVNSGRVTLRDVRLGVVLQIAGPLDCNGSTIAGPRSPAPEPVLLCRDRGDMQFALAFLSAGAGGGGEWLSGLADEPGQITERIARAASMGPARLDTSRGGTSEDFTASVLADRHQLLYGIIPVSGTFAPGDTARLAVALLAGSSTEEMEGAIVEAYKTYAGDGTNRFLPPPLSLTRRVLWGRFERLDSPREGVLITIENARAEGLKAGHLSFLGSMPAEEIEIVDDSGRDLSFIYHGPVDDGMIDSAGRMVMRVRVSSTEMCEIILRPGSDLPVPARSAAAERRLAEEYWQHAGELDEELLSSSPNPFRESTVIFYEVPSHVQDEQGREITAEGPFETSVKVYNVSGQLVTILADWVMGPGGYTAEWNGIDDNGTPVASGVYYVKLQIEQRHITKRLTLVR